MVSKTQINAPTAEIRLIRKHKNLRLRPRHERGADEISRANSCLESASENEVENNGAPAIELPTARQRSRGGDKRRKDQASEELRPSEGSGGKHGCRPADGRQKFDLRPDARMRQRVEMVCMAGLRGASLPLPEDTESWRADEPCRLDITVDNENHVSVCVCVCRQECSGPAKSQLRRERERPN